MLYVRITDYDSYNEDDHVGNIYIPIHLNPDESIQRDTYTGGYGRFELSIQLSCQSYFFDRNCSTYCFPINVDGFGHFRCGPQGERICLKGWRDPGNHCLTRKQFHTINIHLKQLHSLYMQQYVKNVTQLVVHALHRANACKSNECMCVCGGGGGGR